MILVAKNKAKYKKFEEARPKKDKDEVEIIYTPEHSKAIDRSKDNKRFKPKV